jgi:hypothetical protein
MTLERLLSACGTRLDLALATGGPSRSRSRRPRITRDRERLLEAARRHGIRRVRLFGSVARRNDRAASDIDLLVDLGPGRTLVDAIGFQQEAAEILGVPVDVATSTILKPDVRRRVLRDAVPL